MKVALLTNFVPPYRVPVYRALRERAGALRVFISTAMEKNRSWQAEWADLDVVVQRTWTQQRHWRHERFTEPYELHVPYDTLPQLRRYRPDVVVTSEFGARTLQALLYGALAGVPVVLWVTGTAHLEPSRGRARALLRRALVRAVRAFIVNGAGGAEYLRALGVPEARMRRVPQAVDVSLFAKAPLTRAIGTERCLLCSGRLSEAKGLRPLFDGVAEFAAARPDVRLRLLMVGDGPLRAELQARPLPPTVTVEWTGAVPYAALPGLYARADLVIFPTFGDEWGLVVNEAMASAVPVIGSVYAQAVTELIEDGVNGWIFRPDSAADVRRALETAWQLPDEALAEMRSKARASALRITPEQVAERIHALLQEAMK